MPSWLHSPRPVLLGRFVRTSINDPLLDQVELQDVNPTYANVRYTDDRESTVSLRDLVPCPSVPIDVEHYSQAAPSKSVEENGPTLVPDVRPDPEPCSPTPIPTPRHSTHEVKPPSPYGWWWLVFSWMEDNYINFGSYKIWIKCFQWQFF